MDYLRDLPVLDRPIGNLHWEAQRDLESSGWLPFPDEPRMDDSDGWWACVRLGCSVMQHYQHATDTAFFRHGELVIVVSDANREWVPTEDANQLHEILTEAHRYAKAAALATTQAGVH